MTSLLLLGGLAALCLGAELLVRGASRLAFRVGVPPLVVGLTVVAFGTSAPEMVVSAQGALNGQAGLVLGNVVGSNIFNVLFILGVCATLAPLVVSKPVIWREVPVMVAASVLAWFLASDGRISRAEGVLLLFLLTGYTAYQVRSGLRQGNGDAPAAAPWSLPRSIGAIAGGLAVLVLGARWFLAGGVEVARALGLSEFVIGLTVIAAGTSLPEVATSLLATRRGERDIAVGNVVGSNIFNLLGVLGLAAVLAPRGVTVDPPALAFDIPVMLVVAVACLPIFFTGHLIARWEGGLFLFYYAAYTLFLVWNTTGHDALPAFSAAMLWVAVPLTSITILIGLSHHLRGRKVQPAR